MSVHFMDQNFLKIGTIFGIENIREHWKLFNKHRYKKLFCMRMVNR